MIDPIANFWDTADLELLERVALESGVSKYDLARGNYAPIFTYWKYVNVRSKARLAPAIKKFMEEEKRRKCYLERYLHKPLQS